MKRIPASSAWHILAVLFSLFLFSGCSSKDSAGKGESSASDGAVVGQGDADAVKAVSDELAKHWLQTPDGWVSEYPAKTYLATGERAGPESFYRQIKELKFNLEPNEISDSDKLNGIQFRGYCEFSNAPARIYGDPNAFGPPKWSEWNSGIESLSAVKRNGQWVFSANGYLLSGTKPSATTISQLK